MSSRQYTIYTKEGNVKLSTINEDEAWFNFDREAGDDDYNFELVDFSDDIVV